jgi:hypothetical protein
VGEQLYRMGQNFLNGTSPLRATEIGSGTSGTCAAKPTGRCRSRGRGREPEEAGAINFFFFYNQNGVV